MSIERRVVDLTNCEIRETAEGDGRTFIGYASVFNSPAMIGSFREQVAPTAFTRAIDEAQDVRLLFNHDSNLILGRSGRNLTLNVDERGLRVEANLPNTSIANDLIENMRMGIVTQMSFGFSVPAGGDEWTRGKDGVAERTLNDVDLFDVSPVVYPAYNDTTAEVRARANEVRAPGMVWDEEMSASDFMNDVQAALPAGSWVWDVSIGGDKALVCVGDDMFVVPLTMNGDEPVPAQQSEWTEVVQQWVPGQDDDDGPAEGDGEDVADTSEFNSLRLDVMRLEKRAGKVLSDKNMAHVSAAVEHLQQVMADATESTSTSTEGAAGLDGVGYNSARARKIALLEAGVDPRTK